MSDRRAPRLPSRILTGLSALAAGQGLRKTPAEFEADLRERLGRACMYAPHVTLFVHERRSQRRFGGQNGWPGREPSGCAGRPACSVPARVLDGGRGHRGRWPWRRLDRAVPRRRAYHAACRPGAAEASAPRRVAFQAWARTQARGDTRWNVDAGPFVPRCGSRAAASVSGCQDAGDPGSVRSERENSPS